MIRDAIDSLDFSKEVRTDPDGGSKVSRTQIPMNVLHNISRPLSDVINISSNVVVLETMSGNSSSVNC